VWRDRLNSRDPTRGARVTRPRRHPFEADEAAHVINEVRHSDLAPRANNAMVRTIRSHAVLLITEYMLDAGAPSSAPYWRLLRLTEFAITIRPCDECGSLGALSELFSIIAAIGAVGHTSKPCCSYREHLRTFDCRARSRRSPRNGARICAGGQHRYGSCNRNTSVHASSSSARPCPSGGSWPAWIPVVRRFAFLDRLVVSRELCCLVPTRSSRR